MASSSAEIFQKVRDAVDIVDVIGEHVALKRAGREFKGLCPFHEDHRPSMAVVPHKQIFHCFVCGSGGDVFKFVELYHKMSKGETLRFLAQRAGIQLPELQGSRGSHEGPSQREQIAQTNEWACAFFESQLRSPSGRAGLDYLYSRGLTDETIAKFRLGFAPDSWTSLVNAAMRLSIRTEQLEQAGLIKKRSDGSPYDVFRNRVMFPIIDATGGAGKGRVIAFGGRVLVEKRDEQGNVVDAKYLNSPETLLFNKSESMYGLNWARQQIVRTRTAAVVEGYMDVIASHQSGVSNVVATLGTALTLEHTRVLKNYAQDIILAFDSDDAGRRAADRAMEVFLKSPLDIKITSVPDGKDPCDFCMKNGGDAFQKLLDNAVDAMTYQWNRLRTAVASTDEVAGKQEAVANFMRFAAASMGTRAGIHNVDPIRRGQLIIKLAKITGLPVEEVTVLLYQASYKEPRQVSKQLETAQEKHAKFRREQQESTGRYAKRDAQRWLLGCLMTVPPLYLVVRDDLNTKLFDEGYQLIASLIFDYLEHGNDEIEKCSLADFSSHVHSLQESQDDRDLAVYCAILWDRIVGAWLEPEHLSTAKLLTSWRVQLGHTPEMVVRDCVQLLKELRGREDEEDANTTSEAQSLESDPELSKYVDELKWLSKRNREGGNRRILGPIHDLRPATVALTQRMMERERIAETVGA